MSWESFASKVRSLHEERRASMQILNPYPGSLCLCDTTKNWMYSSKAKFKKDRLELLCINLRCRIIFRQLMLLQLMQAVTLQHTDNFFFFWIEAENGFHFRG